MLTPCTMLTSISLKIPCPIRLGQCCLSNEKCSSPYVTDICEFSFNLLSQIIVCLPTHVCIDAHKLRKFIDDRVTECNHQRCAKFVVNYFELLPIPSKDLTV